MSVKLYIKHMVCNRCKMAVETALSDLGLQPLSVELGEVELARELSSDERAALEARFAVLGFELIDDRRSRIIEKIKNVIVERVHHSNEPLKTNLSEHLSQQLSLDYSYLSNLFSQVEDETIEHFYIRQKIERAKELLVYDELNLNEIADRLHYSSAAYLSRQFKQVTGFSPTHYRQLKQQKRIPLHDL